MECKLMAGQQVVCIEDHRVPPGFSKPIVGCVYTVREVGVSRDTVPAVFVALVEIPDQHCTALHVGSARQVWQASRFRPCKPTDISEFTKLLKRVDTGVPA
jgi:hypothetical protein